VDWFKTDSQGMDLRLFRSLGEPLLQKVLAADFEPGIIDAYEGEDKFHSLLAFMDSQPFFVSRVRVRGSQRLNRSVLRTSYTPLRLELLVGLTRQSPGWAEISYLNDLRDRERFGQRERLLQIVFAVIQEQFGFALELAVTGFDQSGDPLFRWCQKRIVRRMLLSQLKKGFFAGLGVHLLKTALMPLYAKRR